MPSLKWGPGSVAAAVVLGLLAVGCSGSEAQPASPPAAQAEEKAQNGPPDDAIAVEVAAATRRTLSEVYGTSATLRADKQATVTARTRGVIRPCGSPTRKMV